MVQNNALRSKPALNTERLLLRPVSLSDAPNIFAYASDPEMTEFTLWAPHRNISDSARFVAVFMVGTWGIVHKADDQFIGTCSFTSWQPRHRRAEIAYALSREHWGQGYTTEAVRAAIDYGFNHMDLKRIEARFVDGNVASQRVLEKSGMTREGTLRQSEFARGKHHDMVVYSILRGEWDGE